MQVDRCKVTIQAGTKMLNMKKLDGKTIVVLPADADYYEVEMEEKDPFGEAFTQKYRYTPFTIQINDSQYTEPICVKCFVDGKEVHSMVMLPGTAHNIKGVNTPEGLKELVFSPPRVAPASSKEKNENLGTIRIELYKTTFLREEENWTQQTFDLSASTKKDCNKVKVLASVTAGNVLSKTASKKTTLFRGVTKDDIVTSAVFRYVTQFQMEYLLEDSEIAAFCEEPLAKRSKA